MIYHLNEREATMERRAIIFPCNFPCTCVFFWPVLPKKPLKIGYFKMAPEEGLEPSTSRLTAACSTIELLWNAKGRVIYKPFHAASNRFAARNDSITSSSVVCPKFS